MGGISITRATNLLAFAFIASRHGTLEPQSGLLAASTLSPADPALDTALASAPITVRIAFAQLTTSDGALVVPLLVPSASMGHVPCGSCLRRPARALPAYDEDFISTTPSSQSLLAEKFLVTLMTRDW